MKNKKVIQMMIDVENQTQNMKGLKTSREMGWHGFDKSGLFHCSGSNLLWIYEDVVVSIKGNGESKVIVKEKKAKKKSINMKNFNRIFIKKKPY